MVVSNTSPLNYLVLIEEVDVLARLYGRVLVPPAVILELEADSAPQSVRDWIARKPDWLELYRLDATPAAALQYLGSGEREAITLARQVRAGALLMDDRDGRHEAERQQIRVIGTLAVLADAAESGLLDLREAIQRLRQTSFRASPALLKMLLDRHRKS